MPTELNIVQSKYQFSPKVHRHNNVFFPYRCIADNIVVIGQAFKNDLVIPEFNKFIGEIQKIYNKCKLNQKGKVSLLNHFYRWKTVDTASFGCFDHTSEIAKYDNMPCTR